MKGQGDAAFLLCMLVNSHDYSGGCHFALLNQGVMLRTLQYDRSAGTRVLTGMSEQQLQSPDNSLQHISDAAACFSSKKHATLVN
jgi:hypothetical protein